jgi:hypothetical protein
MAGHAAQSAVATIKYGFSGAYRKNGFRPLFLLSRLAAFAPPSRRNQAVTRGV